MSNRWKGEGGAPRPLIVTATDATRIVGGRKTQLLRMTQQVRLNGGQRVLRACGMRPGTVYDVQTSMESAPVARIIVTDVTEIALADITFEQARAEGHRTRADFADAWMRRHDTGSWPLMEETICPKCEGHAMIDGERCDGGCDDIGTIMQEADLDEVQILRVFAASYAGRRVWAVAFEHVQHLYLHRKTDGGYTADPREALIDAGAVLDPPHPDWARHAEIHRREDLRSTIGARLAGRGPAERLEELQQIARERRIDATAEARVTTRIQIKAAQRLERKILGQSDRHAA